MARFPCLPERSVSKRPALTVWYDGGCPLCVGEIAFIQRLTPAGAIEFVNLDSASDALCPIDRAQLLARFHAREPDGRLLSGAAAFAAMWRRAPLLRPLGLLASAPGFSWLFERLYRIFLRFRPRLQRLTRTLTGALNER